MVAWLAVVMLYQFINRVTVGRVDEILIHRLSVPGWGFFLNLRMLHDQLVRQIHKFGVDARESWQVYKRLSHLLPDRMRAMTVALKKSGKTPAQCVRLACVSDELMEHINEIVEIGASSRQARIEYETHMMLIDARRTLRAVRISNTR